MTQVIGLIRHNERYLVFRAATSLVAGQFTTEVGVVDLDTLRQQGSLFTFEHDLHELVL
jgi:hypothetical protein